MLVNLQTSDRHTRPETVYGATNCTSDAVKAAQDIDQVVAASVSLQEIHSLATAIPLTIKTHQRAEKLLLTSTGVSQEQSPKVSTMVSKLCGANILLPPPLLLPLLLVPPLVLVLVVGGTATRAAASELGACMLLLLLLLLGALPLLLLLLLLLLLRIGCLKRQMLPAVPPLLPALLPLRLRLLLLLLLLGVGGSSTACGGCPSAASSCCASASKNLQATSGCLYCSCSSSKYFCWACCSMFWLMSVRVSEVTLL
jgi:hypothetical protein